MVARTAIHEAPAITLPASAPAGCFAKPDQEAKPRDQEGQHRLNPDQQPPAIDDIRQCTGRKREDE
jgi:hypothetical protein